MAVTQSTSLAADPPCKHSDGSYVLVETQAHRLILCSSGQSEHSYTISLGREGTGKHSTGDNRTPLGVYSLGQPRPSSDFHLFVPVGYPTAAQRRAGFTGSDIGIHGPKRGWRWLGPLLNLRDWTRGCIAVNSVSDMEEIASWIKRVGATWVELR